MINIVFYWGKVYWKGVFFFMELIIFNSDIGKIWMSIIMVYILYGGGLLLFFENSIGIGGVGDVNY